MLKWSTKFFFSNLSEVFLNQMFFFVKSLTPFDIWPPKLGCQYISILSRVAIFSKVLNKVIIKVTVLINHIKTTKVLH